MELRQAARNHSGYRQVPQEERVADEFDEVEENQPFFRHDQFRVRLMLGSFLSHNLSSLTLRSFVLHSEKAALYCIKHQYSDNLAQEQYAERIYLEYFKFELIFSN